ncbi:FkbM family methyltransferase [Sphingomonas jatrophae]|uniref:Methyltransferase, FkbM family n=1 Tax=Sphingomonas jatrophae TaxID=1166337 RepID=A0A1I6L6E4_9SPHN|nr:FkbM family methyltransferase [Sphingomonas jatrophae]SFR99036.1 methyltransferase, FkbM family [Sphingomonas jatrophae]
MITRKRLAHALRKRWRKLTEPRRGDDVLVDLSRLVKPAMIFDVGANIGQSSQKFARRFPSAAIHCFEPSAASAQRIRERKLRGVEVHALALGSEAGTATLTLGADPATFRIADGGDEAVAVDTIDAFCATRSIQRIDFVKIDTEGHDLEVLKGAAGMLAAHRIAAVQVEAGMNPENKLHVPFEALKAYLEGHGYRLFGFYDQASEWPTRQPHLRRANPLFVSPELFARPAAR